MIRRFERRARWFEETRFGPDTPGLCRVTADERGLLWVRVTMPTMRFQGAFETLSVDLEGLDRARDVIVEVIDPTVGRVVARSRFDEATLEPLKGTDLWQTTRQDQVGYMYRDLWRVRIDPPIGSDGQ